MTDESSKGADERPRFFNSVTGWIGGLTAVVIALAGLREAYQQLMPAAPAEKSSAVGAAVPGETPDTASDQAPEAALPISYTGTWNDAPLTLDWVGGIWVEKTGDLVTDYEQLSRDNGMDGRTYAKDHSRGLYVRWPNKGGVVEQSPDNETWSFYYTISAVADEQSAG